MCRPDPFSTLSFFTESSDVRTAIPIEEGLRVSAETQMALISMSFGTSKELHHKGFCLIAVSLSRGVKGLLSCQPVIPQVITLVK